jgi:hypothetical protein
LAKNQQRQRQQQQRQQQRQQQQQRQKKIRAPPKNKNPPIPLQQYVTERLGKAINCVIVLMSIHYFRCGTFSYYF